MKYSTEKKKEITCKIVQLINNSSLLIEQDLEILEAILNKYNFKTIPNYCKEYDANKTTLYSKVGRDDFAHKVINGIPFVIPSFL